MRLVEIVSLVMAAAFAVAAPAGLAAGKPKSKKGAKQGYDYEKSRYKSYRVLTDEEPRTYKFDKKGNPVPPPSRKKPARKKAPAKASAPKAR